MAARIYPIGPLSLASHGGTTLGHAVAQEHFVLKEFRVFGERLHRVRVALHAGVEMLGSYEGGGMPASLFASSGTSDARPLILECSRCGAPVEPKAKTCRYCASPFTWRPLLGLAYDGGHIELGPMHVAPGVAMKALFTSAWEDPIVVDCAFVGEMIPQREILDTEAFSYSGLSKETLRRMSR